MAFYWQISDVEVVGKLHAVDRGYFKLFGQYHYHINANVNIQEALLSGCLV